MFDLIKGFHVRYPGLTRKFEVCFTAVSRNSEIAALICQSRETEKMLYTVGSILKVNHWFRF